MKHGPNVNKLIIHKMTLIMIPPGTGNPLGAGIKALSSLGGISGACKEAEAWVMQAIAVVKTSPDNPYANDEDIAGAILNQLAAKKAAKALTPTSTQP